MPYFQAFFEDREFEKRKLEAEKQEKAGKTIDFHMKRELFGLNGYWVSETTDNVRGGWMTRPIVIQ